jgi:hypothetical protein
MPAFAAEVQLAVFATRETHAEIDEFLHTLHTLMHENVDGLFVAEAGAGNKRIFKMFLRVIPGTERGGDTALRIGRSGIVDGVFRDDRHATDARGLQREEQAGNARTDDQEMGFLAGHLGEYFFKPLVRTVNDFHGDLVLSIKANKIAFAAVLHKYLVQTFCRLKR